MLIARAPDLLALIWMKNDSAAALDLCKLLHDLRGDVVIALRCDNNPPETRARSPMPAKFPGRCSACATGIRVGEPIFFDSERRQAIHARCA
jgi:hypothetical protein